MLLKIVVGVNLEPSKYLSISPLHLDIASGMCHKSKAELDADVLAVLLEVLALELGPVVGDDSVRDPEPQVDALVMLTTGVASGHLVN
jgi:hypothetical protein